MSPLANKNIVVLYVNVAQVDFVVNDASLNCSQLSTQLLDHKFEFLVIIGHNFIIRVFDGDLA